MARQLLYIAKIHPGSDEAIDRIVENLKNAQSLNQLVESERSGRGLIHWACWYDPWLMGNDLNPEHCNFQINAIKIGDHVWELSLKSGWDNVIRESESPDYAEQNWLRWHLWQTYKAFEYKNDNARVFYGRSVHGASLDDSELIGFK
ncbi:MAG: hypothetical protein AAGL98_08010 [Planctomycetota bacterium]